MSLLPKSIHRCRRYPTKFNSGRDIPLVAIGALYVPFAWLFGYVPALVTVISGVALYEGMSPSWRMAAVAIGGTALFWLLFSAILGVPQPSGVIF